MVVSRPSRRDQATLANALLVHGIAVGWPSQDSPWLLAPAVDLLPSGPEKVSP
jgi:hypothetical protein